MIKIIHISTNPKCTRNKNEESSPMTEEKKTNSYKKPEVEVIKLDKNASFMTESTQTITTGGVGGQGGQMGFEF